MEGTGKRIRLLLLDVDGVLTDGRLGFDGAGREIKFFHVRDGQGIRLLQQAGVKVGILIRKKVKGRGSSGQGTGDRSGPAEGRRIKPGPWRPS